MFEYLYVVYLIPLWFKFFEGRHLKKSPVSSEIYISPGSYPPTVNRSCLIQISTHDMSTFSDSTFIVTKLRLCRDFQRALKIKTNNQIDYDTSKKSKI